MRIELKLTEDQIIKIVVKQIKADYLLQQQPCFKKDPSCEETRNALRVLYRYYTGKELK